MRALLVSTSLAGGAGGAAARLHRGLTDLGVTSRVLVARGADPADPGVVLQRGPRADRLLRRLERWPLRRFVGREPAFFSVQWAPSGVHRSVAALDPEIVNLHWVCGGFVPVRSLARMGRPIVWTLHDMWAFTGGCHYSDGCERYLDRCGACPQLDGRPDRDLSRRVWERKHRAWRDVPLTIVAPSKWLANCARQSALFRERRVEVIPYGIDLQAFRPTAQTAARQQLGLPLDRQIVLFGAWGNVRRKGREELVEALRCLSEVRGAERLCVVSFGPVWAEESIGDIAVRSLGKIDDAARLATVYSAADVYVLPSLADNLPNTVIEAMACGTPCVGFRTGGVPDLIEHRQTGFVAEAFDPASLAEGIAWVLADEGRRQELGARAREKAERDYGLEGEARRYRQLFESILGQR